MSWRNVLTTQEKVIQKQGPQVKTKKQKWGPQLLVDRPRRNTGDNRTIIQKAVKFKSYKNLEAPTKGTGNSFAALDPQYLSQIASNVGVSLGNDTNAILSIINCIRKDENDRSNQFKEDYPKIALPFNLEVELPAAGVNTCPTTQVAEDTSLQIQLRKETWSQIVQKSIDANKEKNVNDDRSILEH
jgi:hypothetical protein